MKKLLMILWICLLFLLTSCSKQNDNQLEEMIREYDYYTEIFSFETENRNIRLFAAYLEGEAELSYIYYSDQIKNDYEILVYVDGEIIYEAFVVDVYEEDDQVLGSFHYSDFFTEDEQVLAEIRVVQPGFITAESYVGVTVAQEFYLLKNIEDKDVLEHAFVDASNYEDKELEVDGLGALDAFRKRVQVIIAVVAVIVYFGSLFLYKMYYTKQLQKQLQNPKKMRFLPDIATYKYLSFIGMIFLTIGGIILSLYIIGNSKDQYEFYDQYQLNYEAVESERVNLRYGSNTPTTMVEVEDKVTEMAFVKKVSSHRIIGYVEILTGDIYPVRTIVPEGSSGGYEYQLIYRHLMGDGFTIIAYERYYGEQVVIFERFFDYDGWGD